MTEIPPRKPITPITSASILDSSWATPQRIRSRLPPTQNPPRKLVTHGNDLSGIRMIPIPIARANRLRKSVIQNSSFASASSNLDVSDMLLFPNPGIWIVYRGYPTWPGAKCTLRRQVRSAVGRTVAVSWLLERRAVAVDRYLIFGRPSCPGILAHQHVEAARSTDLARPARKPRGSGTSSR